MGIAIVTENSDAPVEELLVCPNCGSADWEMAGPFQVHGIETYTKRCNECGDTWDAE